MSCELPLANMKVRFGALPAKSLWAWSQSAVSKVMLGGKGVRSDTITAHGISFGQSAWWKARLVPKLASMPWAPYRRSHFVLFFDVSTL
jgi:hypothetical protein